MSYIGYFFRRLMAKITDDKDELNNLKEERKIEQRKKREELKEKEKEKEAEAEEKKQEEPDPVIINPDDLEGSRCFGNPIQLNTTNFFSHDVFTKYYNKVMPDSSKSENSEYVFNSLDEAKVKCQKSSSLFPTKCTGIITYSNTKNVTRFLVYDDDPTLVNTVKANTNAAKFAAKNPQFIPAPDCAVAEAGPPKPTMCFTTTIQLSPTNFFKDEPFAEYIKMLQTVKGGARGVYTFDTLEAAKAKCQTMKNCKGIIVGKDGGSGKPSYNIYIGDTTLVDTVKNGSIAKMIASQNPQFITAISCKALADAEERKTFSVKRMFKRAFGVTMNILHIFLLIALGLFGASLATNLNVYRGWPYRILYAIYGFVFFFVVIPYVLLWRWLYQKKRPRFYALIPLISSPPENNILATLLSWFTFEPDDEIAFLDGCRA